jgi:hypothetical protein
MRYLRLVALTGGLLALTRCGNPESPAVPAIAASPFFNATIDGTSWVPDTAWGLVLAGSSGAAVIITASRLVSAQEGQDIFMGFPGFPAAGQFPLADLFSPAFAYFSVYRVNGVVRDRPLLYMSGSAQPGLLSITAITDSLMTGTFTFEGATIPDSTPHRVLTGQFRVRYQVAQSP